MIVDRKKKVFIAIPNLGTIVPSLAYNLIQWTHDPRYTVQVFMPQNIFPQDAARNFCVKKFLESDCEYILWIDDDVFCPMDALHRLVSHDKDMVGAAVFAMKYEGDEAFPYPVTLRFNEEKKYQVYYGSGLEEIDATGSACLLIKRKVYEHPSIERPYIFSYHRDGTLSLTCDFDFNRRAKEAGFKLWADWGIVCSHVKEVDLKMLNNLLVRIKNGK
ncbi:MAG: glycosyltransferase [Deltaproteobacteria bacterium]|nr:glycosyltransferase [Deltaproteobacteria bacterium]